VGGFGLQRLGEFRLRDLSQPEVIYQLTHADLPADFPPIRTIAERTSNLPLQVSTFIGRDRELSDVRALVASSRLVTLTGAGGVRQDAAESPAGRRAAGRVRRRGLAG
jgi:hypothetical protein